MVHEIFPELLERYPQSIPLICNAFPDRVEIAQEMPTRFTVNPQRRALHLLLGECEAARSFDWTAEPSRFIEDRDALKDKPDAVAAANKLADYFKRYPSQSGWPLSAALYSVGAEYLSTEQLQQIKQNKEIRLDSSAMSVSFAGLLSAIAREIDSGGLLAKRGNFLYRFQYGPLLFEAPLDADSRHGNLPDKETAHLTYIVFLLRKLTDGSNGRWQYGEPMPRSGRPLYKIAVELTQETFGPSELDSEGARQRVKECRRRNPGLGFAGYERGAVGL